MKLMKQCGPIVGLTFLTCCRSLLCLKPNIVNWYNIQNLVESYFRALLNKPLFALKRLDPHWAYVFFTVFLVALP